MTAPHFDPASFTPPHEDIEELSIAEAQAQMASGSLTARRLTEMYLARIAAMNTAGPELRAVIETNPHALDIADALDRERAASGPRGPLHGIPILLKDNIDTADEMLTTAGSLALAGSRPAADATVAARLRAAGAVLLGKANMSEWANFRSSHSSSGWSGRGGQARNPYALDRSPSGSSSGSATAVAANLTLVSLGSETNGSILSPANANGVVGLKPTVGLTSRAGVVPISHTQDTIGPFGRCVADVAATLGALTGVDPRDPATQASAASPSATTPSSSTPTPCKARGSGLPARRSSATARRPTRWPRRPSRRSGPPEPRSSTQQTSPRRRRWARPPPN